MSHKHRNKFTQKWASQTDIGRPYGLSGIAVGKVLIEAGLRDAVTKQPTSQALAEGWAIATPLQDGTPHFMWSRTKVAGLLADRPKLSRAEQYAYDVRRSLREADRLLAQGEDKLASFALDAAWDAVPAALRDAVRQILEQQ